MLNGLDLFSGIGGLTIALNEWVRPVAYCEIDPYCQAILLSRQSVRDLPPAPIWDDITNLQGSFVNSLDIDILYGGFPCQDISVAGLGKGLAGKRSGLFWEIVRLSKEIKPKFIFLENVPAITSRGGLTVVRAIVEMGYDCRWCVISAASLGAPHKRERWFLLAHSDGERLEGQRIGASSTEQEKPEFASIFTNASDTVYKGCDDTREKLNSIQPQQGNFKTYWQQIEPPICGVDDAVPYRVDRIRSLGNAVVPCQAKEAFEILMGLKK